MTTFLFWNFGNASRVAAAADLALAHDVDVLVLAEDRVSPAAMLRELNRGESLYHYPKNTNPRFLVFTKFPGDYLLPIEDHPRMTVRRLRLPGKVEILFAAIHFFDRRNHTPADQHSLSHGVAQSLRDAEARAGHARTVLVGDFNMNPFEPGMIDPGGFGAMMTRPLARKHRDAEGRRAFYNPMWGRLGDATPGPPGTFYFPNLTPGNIYWHTLDQVLVRPDLLDSLRDEDVEVLTKASSTDGEIELLREKTKHWKIMISDHLPIVFKLNLPTEAIHA